MRQLKEERSIGELFGELSDEVSTLFRQEMELAKVEISQNTSKIGREAALLAVGGAVAYAGFLALLAAVIVGLANAGLPWWASALLVGAAAAATGYFLIQSGLDGLKKNSLAPRQTIETLRELGNGRQRR